MAQMVGGEIDAYCTKCKRDNVHAIVALVDGEAARVQCKSCNTQHNFRAPRAGAAPRVARAATRAVGSAPARPRRSTPEPHNPSREWRKAMDGRDAAGARAYSMAEGYNSGDLLRHPKFGTGLVTEVLAGTKVAVLFEDGRRVLVMNKA